MGRQRPSPLVAGAAARRAPRWRSCRPDARRHLPPRPLGAGRNPGRRGARTGSRIPQSSLYRPARSRRHRLRGHPCSARLPFQRVRRWSLLSRPVRQRRGDPSRRRTVSHPLRDRAIQTVHDRKRDAPSPGRRRPCRVHPGQTRASWWRALQSAVRCLRHSVSRQRRNQQPGSRFRSYPRPSGRRARLPQPSGRLPGGMWPSHPSKGGLLSSGLLSSGPLSSPGCPRDRNRTKARGEGRRPNLRRPKQHAQRE